MGYAARLGHHRWAWLYRQPTWRRVKLALVWFRQAHRRRMFRGAFWRWLWRGGLPPQWDQVKADHVLIRDAQRQAREAAKMARRST